jgi:phosphoribosylformimino-5-aminoimidazole carboxamide ribotide isomerase
MFRPCIDLHEGKVKQIVGGSLTGDPSTLKTNFVSERSSRWYAELYRRDGLSGGHVIMLGPGNHDAAVDALKAYPNGLQVGGGIKLDNARAYLGAGASHVIVTSWIFRDGQLEWDRLAKLKVEESTLDRLARECDEFLIHAADVEGLCRGVDMELVEKLGRWSPIPTTYAGGARELADLEAVNRAGGGRIDLTIGSALDIFGGKGARYEDVVRLNQGSARPGC